MAIQITFIGLGQIGASMGMALAKHSDKIVRVGHDKEVGVENSALKKGAMDKTEHNLPRAVQDAKLVVLSLPIGEIRETLQFIAPDLQDGTVVVDTSPVKSDVAKWAKEILPEGCYYVGLMPAIAAEFLQQKGSGLDAAQADLFARSIFLVSAPSGTPGEAVQLASDFVSLLEATPMLTDILESDGIVASVHLLPQLISAALLNATVDQPGWKDSRKIAGRAYVTTADSLANQDDISSLQTLSLQNRENVARALDVMVAALRGLREDIVEGNEESLKERLLSAHEGRENWLHERTSANWVEMQKDPAKYPSVSERLFGSIIGRQPNKRK